MIDIHNLPNRLKDERTVYLLRRHWIVPLKICSVFLLAAILPMATYLFLQHEFSDLITGTLSRPLLTLFASFYYLALWMFLMQEMTDYYLDTWIVTNERIISIDQKGLFRRTESELHLENVIDVTSDVKGITATFLNFGDLYIQTAGEVIRFHFQQIPHPEEMRQEILKLIDEDRRRHQTS